MNFSRVILASASPRRHELLKYIFDSFEILAADVDETLPDGISPADAVVALSAKKAGELAKSNPHALVIGADTVVSIDGMILGKPRDADDAAGMLRRLSGRVHEVFTGVCLICGEREKTFFCRTEVEFSELSEPELEWYLETGEPFDKAGAYGIQGYGARYVRRVNGDFFNVMGLPVNMLYGALADI